MSKLLRSWIWKLLQFLTGLCVAYYLPLERSPYQDHPTSNEVQSTYNKMMPLFVGVMTANKYINTRACSVWRSWAHSVGQLGGETRFFVGENSLDSGEGGEWCGLPVVVLQGVNDTQYPPDIRKSFLMISWIHKHYGERVQWVLRADDDVFVKVDELLDYLRPINYSESHYIGQAGRGIDNEEGNSLGLSWDENFCMGGPGVVLSMTAVTQLVEKIPYCLDHLLTEHDDVELGRCVRLATGRSCTWNYEMVNTFYHNYGGDRGIEVVPSEMKERVLKHAITIHPIKDPTNMESLAVVVWSYKRTQAQSLAKRASILGEEANLAIDGFQTPPGPLVDLSGDWDLILNHQLYSLGAGGPSRKVPAHLAEGLTRAVGHVVDMINNEASEKGKVIEFQDLYYAYVHNDPVYGVTYILDLLLKYKGDNMADKVRRHVYVRQSFLSSVVESSGPETRGTTVPIIVSGEGGVGGSKDGRQMVTLIVPIAGDEKLGALDQFLGNYEKEVVSVLEPVRLVMVMSTESGSHLELKVREGIENLKNNYPGYMFTVTLVKNETFNRAASIMTGIVECEDDDLLLLLDLDMHITSKALDLVRRFTVQGDQVYFPIVFSHYKPNHPNEDMWLLSSETGHWLDYGFGIMSAYKSDIIDVGGLDTNINGWGKEDVDLFDKFVSSNLTIFRSPSAEFVHRWHSKECSSDLAPDQAKMCHTSRARVYLSLSHLVDKLINSTLLHN